MAQWEAALGFPGVSKLGLSRAGIQSSSDGFAFSAGSFGTAWLKSRIMKMETNWASLHVRLEMPIFFFQPKDLWLYLVKKAALFFGVTQAPVFWLPKN